jgi:glycosyltransferase involved in cell wall biosynthesis
VEFVVKEPRALVVIINWNYARFVADAIRSVNDQTYRNFRCIVVDNGSDDDSVERIVEAIGDHPQFEFRRLPSNLGHLGAAFWVLDDATGEFVTFLDADDVLAPTYLASHLQAHLAAGSAVGFTSSNCIDVNAEGTLLTGGNYMMYRIWQQAAPALRPFERTRHLSAIDQAAFSALASAARYVPPHLPHWCWCPGSSNMFRRTLLDRIRPAHSSIAVFGGVDGFFTPILHALTGTVLIDQPLSAYRVHGANDYSTLPSIAGLYSSYPKALAQSHATSLRVLIWAVDCIDDLLTVAPASRYWQIFETLAVASPHPDPFSQPELKAAFARKYLRLIELFGEFHIFRELRRRMRFPDYVDVVLAGRRRAIPVVDFGRVLTWEIMRNIWRFSRRFVRAGP